MSDWAMAASSMAMAACAIIGTALNIWGGRRHARRDDDRFREVNDKIGADS